jgi:hypothetical protein
MVSRKGGNMNATGQNAAIVVAGLTGLSLVVRLLASPLVRIAVPPRTEPPSVAPVSPYPTNPDSLSATVERHDLFRVTRHASAIVYDPVRLAQPVTPLAPKPTLALVGIVWDKGRDPTAVVEGFPGVDGPRPVRLGETIAGLRVKAIRRDGVFISGLDTTWTLTVREPWK